MSQNKFPTEPRNIVGRVEVGIATDYGLNGEGIESRWSEIFRHPDRPWGPPSLLNDGYRSLSGVESGRA